MSRYVRHLATVMVMLTCVFARAAADAPFAFLHIGGATPDALRRLGSTGAPAFIIDTGAHDTSRAYSVSADATDGSPVTRHALPGVGFVASSPLGRQPYVTAGKPAYRSFDAGGCRFVLLDTAIPGSRRGHLGSEQLRWLEGDLKHTRRGTPIFVASQHAVGMEPREIDDENALLDLLALHNVQAILCSTTTPRSWVLNGIRCVGTPPLDDGSYVRIRMDAASAVIERVASNAVEHVATIPHAGPPAHQVAFVWDDPDVPILERRRFLTELRDATGHAGDARSRADYRLDGGPLVTMARDARDKESVSFIAELLTKPLAPGAHVVTLVLTTGDGQAYHADKTFVVERVTGEAKLLWDDPFDAGASVQAGTVLLDNVLLVAGCDGRLFGLDAGSGRRRWGAALNGAICATPVIAAGTAFVGTEGGTLYALDPRTGRQRWKAELGGPMLAAAAVLGDTVAAVAGSKLIAIDTASGVPKWSVEVAGLRPVRPTMGGGAFYVACNGDAGVVALDAVGGRVRWRSPAPGGISAAAPAFGDGRVYATGRDGALNALDGATGAVVWAARGAFAGMAPAFASGCVYVASRGSTGEVRAFEATGGKPVWRATIGGEINGAALAVAEQTVAISTIDGDLICLDAASGKVRSEYALEPGWVLGAPALAAKALYAASMNGKAYGIALP
jgi:outer membrane protein assembly factor BamB